MKNKTVSSIAALVCGTILFFAASMTAFAQTGVRTADFELNPPEDAVDAFTPTGGGVFHFSFATGKTEWVPFRRPANIQELAELAMRERNPEKGPAGLDFSIRGEIDMRKAQIVILSEDEIKSILSTGALPEKKPTTKAQGLKSDSYYLLKDETDQSTYIFKLRDHSPGYVWQQIAYVRIPDGTSWKKNPDLAALLDVPKADAASNSRRKTNADRTRQKIQQAWDKQEAERKQAEEQARQDAMNKRIEDVKQQSGDTFPKTPEEISLAEELILGAEYDRLLELCKGKKLDFNVNGTRGNKSPLLYQAIEHDPERRNQDFLDRKNKIFEFVLNNGGAAVISTEGGVACVGEAAATNNKFAFDLLVKDGFDFNRKLKIGMTVQEYLLKYRNIAKIDAEIMKKINSESRLPLYMRLPSIDAADLKKELEDKENPVDVNKPDGSGKTLLDYAIDPNQYCSPAIVSTLLDAGAKFKESTVRQISSSNERYYFLPLFWQHRDQLTEDAWYDCFRSSITARNIEAFKFFLEQGFDPDKKTNNPYVHSPLMVVYEDGTQEMVEMMEARGYKKPFWAAVKWNDLDLAKEYLDAGVDVNEPDNVTRKKPISLALSTGNLELAELLLEHGVKVSPDDYRRPGDYYPVASAATNGQTKMVELLLKHGFVPDFPETPGDTKHPRQSSALYIALLHGHYETAKLLLKYGARTDVTGEKTVFDREQGKSVKIDAKLEELFKDDPKALEVLGKKKGFFDF